jgi:hypothetical protein
VYFQNPGDFPEFSFPKAFVPTQLHRAEPEFGLVSGFMHMHVRRFVGFGTVKPDSIPFDAQYSRHWISLRRHWKVGKAPTQDLATLAGAIRWKFYSLRTNGRDIK